MITLLGLHVWYINNELLSTNMSVLVIGVMLQIGQAPKLVSGENGESYDRLLRECVNCILAQSKQQRQK